MAVAVVHARTTARRALWLMASTFIGLIGFTLLPTCPPPPALGGPRLRGHDGPVQLVRLWGGEASAPRGMGGMTNQYAAMPSLHVGWARCGAV
ncbi:phosphatase PAP2 family protein [Streptomyces echinatus]|uniref:phosphatase PAP2 family protein n=1 Tax=Streptomyces echinatus TaxID=67293 RepID=UPI0031EF3CFD